MRHPSTLFAMLALAAALSSCFDATFVNQTGVELQRYEVVQGERQLGTPPLGPDGEQILDPEDFPALFYAPSIHADGTPNAAAIHFDLDRDPPQIRTRVFFFPAPPERVGFDPALQPLPIADYPFDLPPGTRSLRILLGPGFSPTYR